MNRMTRTTRPAFTLLEMLVAIAITAVLVLFVNGVLSSISGAAGNGAAVSGIIQSSRIIGEQIQRDFQQLTGPGGKGVMVILQGDDGDGNRTDQIAFIRSRSSLEPMTPGNVNTFSNSSNAAFVRVWYGHVQPTGTSTFPPAIERVLGRQALFLDSVPPTVHIDYSQSGPWTVGGYTTIPSGEKNWYFAASDVLDADLDTIVNDFNTANSWLTADGPLKLAYGQERLRCNIDPNNTYRSWEIAQMHPYFIGNVSEFAIEFAGDYDSDPGIDTYNTGTGAEAGTKIVWYSHYGSATSPGGTPPTAKPPISADGFATSATGTQAIYIQNAASVAQHAKAGLIFRPGGTDWPKLIRLRYRIADPQGKLAGSDGNPGRIFEQIIRLPE